MTRYAKHPDSGATSMRIAPLLALLLALVGCGDASVSAGPPTASSALAVGPAAADDFEEERDLLKAVRQATARFHSTTLAAAAGYETTDLCVPGMGYHWVNPALVDAVFNPLQPEVMIYASGPNGKPTLVAVEYIVIDAGQPRPAFGGHPFDLGGTPVAVPHWSLHAWLYESNPDGVFAPHNPTISCP